MGKQSRRTRTARPAAPSCSKEVATTAVVQDPAIQGAILRRDMQRVMAEFNSLPSSMNAQRIQAFITYCGLLERLDPKLYTHQDYSFLKKMIKTDTNHNTTNTGHYQVFFRVCAWMYLAGVMSCNGHYDSQGEALQFYDNVIEACDSARETDKKRIITLHGKRATVGTFLSGQRAIAADILKRVSTTACTLMTCTPTGQSSPVPLMAGLICDCCGKVRPENTILMQCGRCKLAHYCSADCQKKAWKELGHKTTCREKHEFRVGDVAACVDPFGDTKTGKHVRIVSPAPAADDSQPTEIPTPITHWVVESKQDDEPKITMTVAAKRLKRVRPGLWCNRGKAELAEWEKTFEAESFDIPGLTTPALRQDC